jgi:ribosomal protein L40E
MTPFIQNKAKGVYMGICRGCRQAEATYTSRLCRRCHSEYMKDWYKKKLETKEGRINDRQRRMFQSARKRAKARNLPFDIDLSDIQIPEYCPALGIKLSLTNNKISCDSPTLDRINPDLGYTKGNVAVISKRANTVKSDATAEEIKKVWDWVRSKKDKA